MCTLLNLVITEGAHIAETREVKKKWNAAMLCFVSAVTSSYSPRRNTSSHNAVIIEFAYLIKFQKWKQSLQLRLLKLKENFAV